jgi:hypothetical protein
MVRALGAHAEQFTMVQRIRDLEQEIARIKAWEAEKQRYQLIAPWPGCFVYALKETSKGTEPPHWICEHCYQDGRKSILQNSEKHNRRFFIRLNVRIVILMQRDSMTMGLNTPDHC